MCEKSPGNGPYCTAEIKCVGFRSASKIKFDNDTVKEVHEVLVSRHKANEVLQASNELLLSKGSQLQEKLARLEMIFGGSDGQATPTSGDRPFGE